jgi:hypothetical protein
MPIYRNLWDHIRKDMPKKGRSKTGKGLDPLSLPARLQTALRALYGHYQETFEVWQEAGIEVPVHARHVDDPVDDDMCHVNSLRLQLSRHALGDGTQPVFSGRERRSWRSL